MRLREQLMLTALVLIPLMFTGACSSKPFLKVQYQLPSATSALDGRKVSLSVADVRKDDVFLTENAKKSLKGFNGTFSLVVLRQDGSGDLVGAYKVDSLIAEIFKQRLRNSGVDVVAAADGTHPALEILLKALKLDLSGRKWKINMSYQARLKDSGDLLASETVNGSAERLKLIGKGEAEKIIGEMLSDMANKLDLVKLFQQARQ
jgi:hypothetical protein